MADEAKKEEKGKRKRSKNFTELEVRFLVDLVIRHINIVENKKTDAVTWKEKEKTWGLISQEFEALTGTTGRTAAVLRSKYDVIKHTIKSKQSKNKIEIFKTGGGSAVKQVFTDYEDKLMSYLSLSINGLPSTYDSDNTLPDIFPVTTQRNENFVTMAVSTSSEPEAVIENYMTVDNTCEFLATDEHITDATIEFVEPNGAQDIINDKQEVNVEAATSPKWSGWNPKSLKEKKHAALATSKKHINKITLNANIDSIVDTREELVKLQIEMLRKEQQLKEEELQKLAEYQEKEYKLKIELLELKIKNENLDILLKEKQLQK